MHHLGHAIAAHFIAFDHVALRAASGTTGHAVMALVFVFYFGALGHVTCQHVEGRKALDTQGVVFDDVLHENPPKLKYGEHMHLMLATF